MQNPIWQSLPTLEIADYLSPQAREQAQEINAAIEAVEDQRAQLDATAAKYKQTRDSFDLEAMETEARDFRLNRVKTIQAEIKVRENLADWFENLSGELERAAASWELQRLNAMNEAREALRKAGFGDLVALENRQDTSGFGDQQAHIEEERCRVNWVLCSFPPIPELNRKLREARESSIDRIRELQGNRRALEAARARLRDLQLAMIPAL